MPEKITAKFDGYLSAVLMVTYKKNVLLLRELRIANPGSNVLNLLTC